jgi:hypothetical protein
MTTRYAVDVMGSNDWGDGPIDETGYDFATPTAAVNHARVTIERALDGRDLLTGMSVLAGHDRDDIEDIYVGAYIYGEPDDTDPMSEGAQWSIMAEHIGDVYPLNPEAEQHKHADTRSK